MAIFCQGQIQTQIPIVGLSVQVKGGRRWRIDYAWFRVGGSASASASTRCRRCVVGKPRAQGHTKMQHEDNNKVASANFQDHLRGLITHWGRERQRPENGFWSISNWFVGHLCLKIEMMRMGGLLQWSHNSISSKQNSWNLYDFIKSGYLQKIIIQEIVSGQSLSWLEKYIFYETLNNQRVDTYLYSNILIRVRHLKNHFYISCVHFYIN